ncbi:MAG TPA: ammonium transporter [Opitutaceae bacterium]|nr:ammonium transporter [Opitutaceae bacterium]
MKHNPPNLIGTTPAGLFLLGILVLIAAPLGAQDAPAYADYEAFQASAGYGLFTTNNLWMMIAAALVFIMHLGFATLETGLTRSKNTVNILYKNTLIPCIGILTYAICGFNLMYPGVEGGWFAFAGFGVSVGDSVASLTDAYNPGYTYWTDFLFQAMFAATAATIVSGAVAERVKLGPFLVFATLFVAVCYPITGYWKWGNGWLNVMETPFYDFAGSTLVHSVGGWGALAGAILLGPRIGKYSADGKMNPILGHSMPLATIGVFLLWLGWFGFNGGSVLSADPSLVSLTLVTTCIAASAGAVGSMLASLVIVKKPDLSLTLNGVLAGLVGITAGADQMAVMSATIIGLVAGVLVVISVVFFDRIKIDDPVGAISVHLVCGIWGTLAVGLLGAKAGMSQLIAQVTGVAAIGIFTFLFAFILFFILKKTVGIRVSSEEEIGGLDIGEHGNEAYPDFHPSRN